MRPPDWGPYVAGIVIAAGFLALSLRSAYRRLLIDTLPTVRTGGVFVGTVELKGTAEPEQPLRSHLAGVPCVYYRYTIRQQQRAARTYVDKNGVTQPYDPGEKDWATLDEGSSAHVPFRLRDDSGEIRILPKGAEVHAREIFRRRCLATDPLVYEKAPANETPPPNVMCEFVEEAILPREPIYVVGHARQRSDAVAAEIAQHDGAPLFLISSKKEESVSGNLRGRYWILGFAGLAIVLAGLFWSGRLHPVRPALYGQTAAFYLAAWLFGWAIICYNSLVALRQRVRQAWSNIDVELKRRADLLPNLVKIVTALRDHENRVQAQIADMRAQAVATAPGAPGPDPAAVDGKLTVVAEAYPELKTSDGFLRLQKQLAEIEDRISLARGYFNDVATFYNARLQMFPEGFVAAMGSLRPQPLLSSFGIRRPR